MLEKQVGETFTGTIVEIDKRDARNGVVMLHDLAIEAALTADVPLPLGSPVQATLVEADPATRRIRFRRSGAPVRSAKPSSPTAGGKRIR